MEKDLKVLTTEETWASQRIPYTPRLICFEGLTICLQLRSGTLAARFREVEKMRLVY